MQSGMGTPGIYGLNEPSKLVDSTDSLDVALSRLWWRMFRRAPPLERGVTVRGQMYMWGDVILHEEGVKSEYAYPRSITDVGCIWCFDWIPIYQWDDTCIPLHATCRTPCPLPDRYEPAGLDLARRGYGLPKSVVGAASGPEALQSRLP